MGEEPSQTRRRHRTAGRHWGSANSWRLTGTAVGSGVVAGSIVWPRRC